MPTLILITLSLLLLWSLHNAIMNTKYFKLINTIIPITLLFLSAILTIIWIIITLIPIITQ